MPVSISSCCSHDFTSPVLLPVRHLQKVLSEHERILQAFLDGDGEEARIALRAHLEGGRTRLRRAVSQGEPAKTQ